MKEDRIPSGVAFQDLPIYINKWEFQGEWQRQVRCKTTIAELLETWDIDDTEEQSQIAQVMRYLRAALAGKE